MERIKRIKGMCKFFDEETGYCTKKAALKDLEDDEKNGILPDTRTTLEKTLLIPMGARFANSKQLEDKTPECILAHRQSTISLNLVASQKTCSDYKAA